MKSKQQSCYGQMPGAFPAEEDEENEAAYLQMMDDLAGKLCKLSTSKTNK